MNWICSCPISAFDRQIKWNFNTWTSMTHLNGTWRAEWKPRCSICLCNSNFMWFQEPFVYIHSIHTHIRKSNSVTPVSSDLSFWLSSCAKLVASICSYDMLCQNFDVDWWGQVTYAVVCLTLLSNVVNYHANHPYLCVYLCRRASLKRLL